IQGVIAAQFFRHENRIDFRSAFKQRNHRHKYAAVRRNIKVAGLQQLNRLSNQRVIENDRTENCAFGVWTAGKCAFKNWVTNRFWGSHCGKLKFLDEVPEERDSMLREKIMPVVADLFFRVNFSAVLFRDSALAPAALPPDVRKGSAFPDRHL